MSPTGLPSLRAGDRLPFLDIAKVLLIASFLVAHACACSLHEAVYWNTGGFVLLSGYLAGLLLDRKPVRPLGCLLKFLKLNGWIAVYVLLCLAVYSQGRKAQPFVTMVATYGSVLEAIALFYLLLPVLKLSARPYRLALAVWLASLAASFLAAACPEPGLAVRLLLTGEAGPSPATAYPLLGFAGMGFLGFAFAGFSRGRRLAVPAGVACLALYGVLFAGGLGLSLERFPPLAFYNALCLAVFALLLEAARRLEPVVASGWPGRFVTLSAKYAVVTFVLHGPLYAVLHKLFPSLAAARGSGPALAAAVLTALAVLAGLCPVYARTFERLPPAWQRRIL